MQDVTPQPRHRWVLKHCPLINWEMIFKRILLARLEVGFEVVRAFCFDFNVPTNRKNNGIPMKFLDLAVCFHNYSQNMLMKQIRFQKSRSKVRDQRSLMTALPWKDLGQLAEMPVLLSQPGWARAPRTLHSSFPYSWLLRAGAELSQPLGHWPVLLLRSGGGDAGEAGGKDFSPLSARQREALGPFPGRQPSPCPALRVGAASAGSVPASLKTHKRCLSLQAAGGREPPGAVPAQAGTGSPLAVAR